MKRKLKKSVSLLVLSSFALGTAAVFAPSFNSPIQHSATLAEEDDGVFFEDIATTTEQSSYSSTHFQVAGFEDSDTYGIYLDSRSTITVSGKDNTVIGKIVVTIGWYEDNIDYLRCSQGKVTKINSNTVEITELSTTSVIISCDGGKILQVSAFKIYSAGTPYQITLETNGGTINSGNVTSYTKSTGATLPTDVTKFLVDFLGWYDNPEFTGEPVTKIDIGSTGDKTFYAKWEEASFVEETLDTNKQQNSYEGVNFIVNNISGKGDNDGFTIDNDWTADISAKDDERIGMLIITVGYQFGNASQFKCTEGKWTVSNDNKTITVTNLCSKKVTISTAGGYLYIKSIKFISSGNVSTVTLELNGGTVKSRNITEYSEVGGNVLPTEVVKYKGEFLGWYDNPEFTGEPVTVIAPGNVGAKTFYAKWLAVNYFKETIDINKKQSSYEGEYFVVDNITDVGSDFGISLYKDKSADISAKNNEKLGKLIIEVGYFFDHANQFRCSEGKWTISSDNKIITVTNICSNKVTISTSDSWLQVKRIEVISSGLTYPVTLELNGGTVKSGNITEYSEIGGNVLPTNVVKYKGEFLGWYDNPEFTGEPVTVIDPNSEGAKTFYAKWLAVNYFKETIDTNKQQNSYEGEYFIVDNITDVGNDSGISLLYNRSADISAKNNEKIGKLIIEVGYYFNNANQFICSEGKWTVSNDNKTITVTNICSNKVTISTSYSWLQIKRIEVISSGLTPTVTLNTNGGTVKSGNITEYSEVGGATLPTNVVKYKGEFLGWYDNPEFTGDPVTEIAPGNVDNKTFYAKWLDVNYFKETIETVTVNKTTYEGDYFVVEGKYCNSNGININNGNYSATVTAKNNEKIGKLVLTIAPSTVNNINNFRCSDGKWTIKGNVITITNLCHNKVTLTSSTNSFLAIGKFEAFSTGIVSKVTLNTNKGTINSGNITEYSEMGGATLPTDITREGCEFLGWYDNAEFTGDPVTEIAPGSTGDKTFYAKWKDRGHFLNEDIATLPNTITLENKDAVDGYKTRYDALDEEEKSHVEQENLDKLNAAVKEINDIETSNAATAKIEAIPATVTIEDKQVVMEAKAAYDALSNEAKAKISSENLNKLNAAVKEINDLETSAAADEKIEALPDVISVDNIDDILAAKDAYNALSDEAKAKIDPDVVNKLDAAIYSADVLSLPKEGELTLDNKDAVLAAKEAYDNLSNEVKSLVGENVVNKLEAAIAEIADCEAAKPVDEEISTLPATVTLDNKDAVLAAKVAYDALTDAQKAKVSSEAVSKLNAAVKEINDIETSNEVISKIDNLPNLNEITADNKDDVLAAKAAYDALSEEAKAKVDPEKVAKLENITKEINDIVAANEVTADINSLPSLDNVTLENKDDVLAAKAAYDALSEGAKAKIDSENVNKLNSVADKIYGLIADSATETIDGLLPATTISLDDKEDILAAKEAYDALPEEAKAKIDPTIVNKLEASVSSVEILSLPKEGELTLDDKEDVLAAKANYDALSDDAKALLPAGLVEKLESAIVEIADCEAAKPVENSIDAIPETVTLDNKDSVLEAKASYDALTDAQKAKVSAEDVAKLEAALKEINDIEVSNAADAKIDALPATITLEDKDDVTAAKAAYDALTDEQKAKVPAEDVAKLVAALKEITDFEAAKPVEDSINEIPATITLEDKEEVEAAKAAYDALTADQKAKIPEEDLAKLNDAVKEINDIEISNAADAKIDALPSTITLDNKAAVEEARAAYDALTEDQKAKIPAEDLAKLRDAETSIAAIESAKANAKAELEKFATDKGEGNYSKENWDKLQGYVTEGNTAIDNAKTVAEVETALNAAKENINEVSRKSNGCGGSIAAASAILSSISLAGASLLVLKKRKKEDK